ncbi:MAG TPA: type I-E CRISPR-associated protein Cas6/Cse3/CasE [Anaerolineae bacterium]|nr:type I-E CRISPR-associated protein Cas6/Cse3/CasE [Anaerolineae bacterium]
MYLSRLILNPGSRRVQREVAEPYQMHRSVMRAFPASLGKTDERVLFRVDAAPHADALTLLVQSWTPPDWSWLGEPKAQGYLLPVSGPNPAVKSFDLHLVAGQVLSFRLRANPTARRKLDDGEHKRLGLYREEEQVDWLRRKGEASGFRVLSVATGGSEVIGGAAGSGDDRHDLKLLAVQFDGTLQVTDPERLRQGVAHGVGSGKGFGFGLLSLAR